MTNPAALWGPRRVFLALAILTAAAVITLPTTTPIGTVSAQEATSLAPFVPTPQDVVDRMLDLAGITENDVVYDLGCGDGRIVITAAQRYGARGVGVDIDPQRIAESNANAERAGVSHLVRFVQEDALEVDVSEASVVTLYLLSSSNAKLRPILTEQLAPGVAYRVARLQHGQLGGRPGRAFHRLTREHPHPVSLDARRHGQTVGCGASRASVFGLRLAP